MGVSRTVASIPDAFDKLRSKRKSDLGPIDFGRPGLMLFVK